MHSFDRSMSEHLEINVFIGRLHEAYRGGLYCQSISRHHSKYDRLINVTLISVSCVSGAALLAYNSMPSEAGLRHVPLISGIFILVNEAVRKLSQQIFQHSQKAEVMRLISKELGLAFDRHELRFVKLLKGQLSEQEIDEAADGLAFDINKAYEALPEGMILPIYDDMARDADRATDDYFCKTFKFTR